MRTAAAEKIEMTGNDRFYVQRLTEDAQLPKQVQDWYELRPPSVVHLVQHQRTVVPLDLRVEVPAATYARITTPKSPKPEFEVAEQILPSGRHDSELRIFVRPAATLPKSTVTAILQLHRLAVPRVIEHTFSDSPSANVRYHDATTQTEARKPTQRGGRRGNKWRNKYNINNNINNKIGPTDERQCPTA